MRTAKKIEISLLAVLFSSRITKKANNLAKLLALV